MSPDRYILSAELLKTSITDTNKYPYNLPVVKHLDKIEFGNAVTFLVGENGSGKSTLLEAIAIAYGFNPEGGSLAFNFSTHDTHSELAAHLRIAKGISRPKDSYFLRAESFYNLASNIDQLQKERPSMLLSYGGKSLHGQSHGESFLSLFLHRFYGHGIYLLDEPEAALSPQMQLALLVRMHELVKEDSQFIVATHSPILLAYPAAKIIQITSTGFEEISYKRSNLYDLYKTFILNPESIIRKLEIE